MIRNLLASALFGVALIVGGGLFLLALGGDTMETFIHNLWPLVLFPCAMIARFGWEIGGVVWRKLGG